MDSRPSRNRLLGHKTRPTTTASETLYHNVYLLGHSSLCVAHGHSTLMHSLDKFCGATHPQHSTHGVWLDSVGHGQ